MSNPQQAHNEITFNISGDRCALLSTDMPLEKTRDIVAFVQQVYDRYDEIARLEGDAALDGDRWTNVFRLIADWGIFDGDIDIKPEGHTHA